MSDMNLFAFALELSVSAGSLYKGNYNDRKNILEFMELNDWFGTTCRTDKGNPIIDEQNEALLREPLVLWLSAYHKPARDKILLLLKHFNGVYPNTCRLYRMFISECGLWDSTAALKLLDFLFYEISKELTEYDESEIESLARSISNQMTRTSARLFAGLLNMRHINGTPLSSWHYAFNARDNTDIISEAYYQTDFAVMAYYVFNDDAWTRQNMIEKAVDNKSFADMWLYIALHFTCAMRAGDMKRLPAPTLPYDGVTVLKNITSGTFTKKEAEDLVDEISIRLRLKALKPSKTSSKNVPNLTFFVPESIKAPLGIITAIVLAHNPEIRTGASFVASTDQKCVRNLNNIQKFFGMHFADVLGNKYFSSRRGNKSYMQGIEIFGNNEPGEMGKPKGYMLASLARSHKSGVGKLAEATEVYLKDACFSGYSPAFIISQMFERGIFSFIPVLLLEIYTGKEYAYLPLSGQTRLVGMLGLTAFQIEGLAEMVKRAMIKSRRAVDTILRNADLKESVGSMLQNIASGAAVGRQQDCLCLMTAAELPCPFSERDSCVGCGYEIYTKTIMYIFIREYKRLAGVIKDAKPTDANRNIMILEHAVIPAVKEILASAKILYPSADINGLYEIMEAELGGVSIITRRD